MFKVLAFCLSVFILTVNSERIRYDNYHVYEVSPKSGDDLKILNELQSTSDSLTFLDDPLFIGKSVHVVVAPHKQPDFVRVLNLKGITHELKEKNLQRELDRELVLEGRSSTDNYTWTNYQTLENTYKWLESLAKKYPKQVKLFISGKTYERRDILGVRVSFKEGNKGIFIEGGIHAREWISPATVTYILNQLLTSQNSTVRKIAENYDWYVFPHVNPDGYVFTQTIDRLWRKNRSPQGACFGVDPNRNWDFHWNEVGASSNPCSETFAGKNAFSEREVRTLSKYIQSLKGKIHTYIAFHSYSQLLLFPYGHTGSHVPNHDDLQKIGNAAAQALSQRYGTKYTVGNVYQTIYPAAGSSMDWAYGKVEIPLSYTYELRPNGQSWNGFVLPPSQIIPTGEETLDSVVALIENAKELGYYD